MIHIIGAPRPKGIPFIVQDPNGQRYGQNIERPIEVEFKAYRFIACQGRYFLNWVSDEEIHLMAATPMPDGDAYVVSQVTTGNGLVLAFAIDRLVRESVEYLDRVN